MGKKSKLPRPIKTTVSVFASHCPICGAGVQDRRYKRRAIGFPLTNRRITYHSVTRECRACGLRFSFRWKTFINALRKKAKLEINPKNSKMMLDRAQDIEDMLASDRTFEDIRDIIDQNESD